MCNTRELTHLQRFDLHRSATKKKALEMVMLCG